MPYTCGVDVGSSRSLVLDFGYTKEIEVTNKLKARMLPAATNNSTGIWPMNPETSHEVYG
jgi:hypothetical protein